MISIVILGSGNLAKHLFDTFWEQNGVEIIQVIGRNQAQLPYFKNSVEVESDFEKIRDADLYFLAVRDDTISEVAKSLETKKGLVVHSSGSVPLTALHPNNRRGVFYPLQSFSVGKKVNFKSVPICVEAENKADLEFLGKLAKLISNNVQEVTSEQRKAMHLAAVFVNNFTNHLFHIAHEICEDHNLPFHILLPLIRETAQKLDHMPPLAAQTGPARRNDISTMENHLNQLKNKNYKDIYALISKSISEKYGKEL